MLTTEYRGVALNWVANHVKNEPISGVEPKVCERIATDFGCGALLRTAMGPLRILVVRQLWFGSVNECQGLSGLDRLSFADKKLNATRFWGGHADF